MVAMPPLANHPTNQSSGRPTPTEVYMYTRALARPGVLASLWGSLWGAPSRLRLGAVLAGRASCPPWRLTYFRRDRRGGGLRRGGCERESG
jgi:hypothetical protein